MDRKYIWLAFIAPMLLALIIILSSQARATEFSDYENVIMKVNITSDFEVVAESSDYSIDYVRINLSFFPRKTGFQMPLAMEFEPDAEVDEYAIYTWDEPKPGKYTFAVRSTVESANDFTKVKSRINFPLKDIPEGLEIYTEPSSNIDSDNQDIEKLASELASGENDEYVVVHKLASWVETNVEYSLDTLTAETSQKASWVLENKRGVCDELTSLFIAMCRSLGIPARYVSGVAYTNYKDTNDWGPHAWAEAYFPGYGWVPFDIAYRQFGIIDPSHIVLKESIDSDEPSTDYEWKSRDVDIKTQKLDIKVNAIKTEGKAEEYLDIKAEPFSEEVGFGSYNLVEATVKNNNAFYYSTEIALAQVNDIETEEPVRMHILLKPFEEKKLFWKIKVDESLMRRYIYTIPIYVYTIQNTTAEARFTSTEDGEMYSNEYISSVMKDRAEEEEKTYSRNIEISCTPEKQEYYFYESIMLECTIRNTGNSYIEGLDVCMISQNDEKKCRSMSIGISQERSIDFMMEKQEPGEKKFRVSASNALVSKSAEIDMMILDEPSIIIDEIIYPENVSFKDSFNITFVLKKKSYSIPEQVAIDIMQNGQKNALKKEFLANDERFVMGFAAKDLVWGENDYSIKVGYYDKNGNYYSQEESFNVYLTKAGFFERIFIAFNGMLHWIAGLFS